MPDEDFYIKNFPRVPFWEHLGIKIAEVKPGYARLVMDTHENLTNPYGYTHGGVLSTLADSAAAVALVHGLDLEDKRLMTVELKINYLNPVSGGVIEARAKALREGRIVPVDIDIYNENVLVAKSIATYIILDAKKD
ncbi:MAG: PaaI family thioesterase [Candidatus Dadabacteria bacterium]|nr:PaaI family thioesterase [Candidatus Dadabacteria bacterium]